MPTQPLEILDMEKTEFFKSLLSPKFKLNQDLFDADVKLIDMNYTESRLFRISLRDKSSFDRLNHACERKFEES